MITYHKINTIFKRDGKGKIIDGDYSLPEFEYLANNKWIWTEKIDGTNIRVFWDHENKSIKIGGRTDNAQIPVKLLYRLQEIFDIGGMMEKFPETSVLFFGEGYGNGIQKLGKLYKDDGVSFCLFDVLINGFWLDRESIFNLSKYLACKYAPIVGSGTISEVIELARNSFKSQLNRFAGDENGDIFIEDKDYNDSQHLIAEGLVIRPEIELCDRRGNRIIAKIKCNDF